MSFAAFVVADLSDYNTAYDYLEKIGIPAAKRIQAQEEEFLKNPISRIFNGSPASLGQFNYQVNIIYSISLIESIILFPQGDCVPWKSTIKEICKK